MASVQQNQDSFDFNQQHTACFQSGKTVHLKQISCLVSVKDKQQLLLTLSTDSLKSWSEGKKHAS